MLALTPMYVHFILVVLIVSWSGRFANAYHIDHSKSRFSQRLVLCLSTTLSLVHWAAASTLRHAVEHNRQA